MHLLVGTFEKKVQGSVISTPIGMTFGTGRWCDSKSSVCLSVCPSV